MSRLSELAAQIAKMISEMLLALSQGRRGGTVIASAPAPVPAAVGNSFVEKGNSLVEKRNDLPHNEIIKLKHYENDSNRALFAHLYAQTPKNKRHLLPRKIEIEHRSGSLDFAKWITDLDDKELSKIASSKYYRVLDHIKNKMMITDVPRIGESRSPHEKLLQEAEQAKLRMKPKIKKLADDPERPGPKMGM